MCRVLRPWLWWDSVSLYAPCVSVVTVVKTTFHTVESSSEPAFPFSKPGSAFVFRVQTARGGVGSRKAPRDAVAIRPWTALGGFVRVCHFTGSRSELVGAADRIP